MLLRSGRDRGARGTLGDGLLSLRELPALFRRAGRAFTLWKWEDVKLMNGAEFLGKFKSSDISDRRYCTKCGSHISVDHSTLGLIDVRIGALRNFPFKPKVHLNYAETVLPMKDGLPKLKDFPASIGGSGDIVPGIVDEFGNLIVARTTMPVELRPTGNFYFAPIPISNPFSSTDGLIVRKSTTPFTGETISSRVSPKKSPTVPICSPSLTASPGATFGYHTPVLFV